MMEFEPTYKVHKHVFPNGKVYVGITSQMLDRRWQGGRGYSGFVRKAIDKTGRPHTEEFKQRVSQQFKGKPLTQEHKDKIAAALRGRKRVVA